MCGCSGTAHCSRGPLACSKRQLKFLVCAASRFNRWPKVTLMTPQIRSMCIFTASALAAVVLWMFLDARYAEQVAFRNRFVEGRVTSPLTRVKLVGYGWTVGITDALSLRAIGAAFRQNRMSDGGDGTCGVAAVFHFRSGQTVRMQVGVEEVGDSFQINSYTVTDGIFSTWADWYRAQVPRPLPPGLAAAFRLLLGPPARHRHTVWADPQPGATPAAGRSWSAAPSGRR